MKIQVTKEWFASRALLEEGLEIGVGIPTPFGASTLSKQPKTTPSTNVVEFSQHLSFGRFVALMRRQRQWSVKQLSDEVESSCEEILSIENDPAYEPEMSTVHGVAKAFGVSPKNLYKMASFTDDVSPHLREEFVRFAACSEGTEPLTHDEEEALQAILKVIVEDLDEK